MNVLVVEDNSVDAAVLEKSLLNVPEQGIQVTLADSLNACFQGLNKKGIDLILLDLNLPDSQGLETLDRVLSYAPRLPVVVCTSVTEEAVAIDAVKRGAQDYIIKGELGGRMLLRVLNAALERGRIHRQLRDLNERLEVQIRTDPLTEILNRRGLQEVLTREIQLARRHGAGLVVLIVDLDNFKTINDQLGHAVGDMVLKEVAKSLQNVLRTTDYVARIGGDEFIVLLPQTRIEEARRISERMRLAISEKPLALPDGKTVSLTISAGLSTVERTTPSVDELLEKTSGVLHKSKRLGKNRVCCEGGGEDTDTVLTRAIESLRQGELFCAVMHPIFELDSEKRVGLEILMRSKIEGFEMPGDFFRASVEADILTLVDHYCLKKAVETLQASPFQDVRYHMNLFPSTMIDIPVEHLISLFPQTGLRGQTFCLEISEQQIFGNPSYLIKVVQELRKAGILIAIDDVGFGRSCLESLILLKPELIKIDRTNVSGIGQDKALQECLKRFLKVAASLDAEVIVEGIETREDLEMVKSLGVKFGQGYLWGKPA